MVKFPICHSWQATRDSWGIYFSPLVASPLRGEKFNPFFSSVKDWVNLTHHYYIKSFVWIELNYHFKKDISLLPHKNFWRGWPQKSKLKLDIFMFYEGHFFVEFLLSDILQHINFNCCFFSSNNSFFYLTKSDYL